MAHASDGQAGNREIGSGRTAPGRGRGMTLIEVLVVLVIIGILATLTITVASRVSGAGKGRMTQDAIRVLDTALTSYVAAKEAIPPAVLRDPRDPSNNHVIPVADARNVGAPTTAEQVPLNTGGFFIYQCQNSAGLSGLFSGLDAKLFTKYDPDSTENQFLDADGNVDTRIDQFAPAGSPGGPSGAPDWDNQPRIPTVLDGWGRPIRYVHPTFGGVIAQGRLVNFPDQRVEVDLDNAEWSDLKSAREQWSFKLIRRNNTTTTGPGDSDGGYPVGGRPYFYSAGPDGDPATLDDNLYSNRPEFRAR